MVKFFLFLFIFLVKISFTSAEIVKSISVTGNERITNETIIIFSKINIGDDLLMNDLNTIINNLYETDFFKNVTVNLKNNILKIEVLENNLVQSVVINGVKNKRLKQDLLDLLTITKNRSYSEEKSSEEIFRLLKPKGTLVFIEPLGTNPIINLYRKFTPNSRSKDEHPLINKDFKYIKNKFFQTQIKYYGLLTLIFFPFYRSPSHSKLFKLLTKLDSYLFKFKIFRLFAWSVLITAKKS